MIEAYPLHWPVSWPRTDRPERSRFGVRTVAAAVKELTHELKMLRASEVVISTNVELRLDGLPRSDRRPPEDKGVAVYFKLDGQNQCFPCDRWDYIDDNLWAIAKSIGALRGINRWGAKTMVSAAFTGFKALPEASGPTIRQSAAKWLSGYFEASLESILEDPLVAQMAVRAAAKATHPDRRDGNDSLWQEFQMARQAIEAK